MQLVSATLNETELSTDLFEDFWILCWRRECKKDARKAWREIDPKDHIEILMAACSWRPIFLARGNTQFTPLPATWLRGERWTDEIPQEFQTKGGSANIPVQNPVVSVPSGPRGPIPAHVQTLIDRLKAKR